MIKLTRKETIELPSWEELVECKGWNNDEIINEDYDWRVGLGFYKGRLHLMMMDYNGIEYNREFNYTEQGYNKAIEKICELGGFEIEI